MCACLPFWQRLVGQGGYEGGVDASAEQDEDRGRGHGCSFS